MSGWLQALAAQAHVFLPQTAQPYSELFAQLHKPWGPRPRDRKHCSHTRAQSGKLGIDIETGLHPISLKLFVSKLKQPPDLIFLPSLSEGLQATGCETLR